MIRIFVALLVLLMASGAVAQKKPTTPSFDGNDVAFCTRVQGGPKWSCKYPKTGKTMKVECKVPPSLAKSMPKKMSLSKLREMCIKGNAKRN